ncbi:MAG TPA: hypothetical protein VMW71_07265 [Thermoplasmata archaeon]|nr:hypothetical protein [Thermoplasmata archaeon]
MTVEGNGMSNSADGQSEWFLTRRGSRESVTSTKDTPLNEFELRSAGKTQGRIEFGGWVDPGAVIETSWGQMRVEPILDNRLKWRMISHTGQTTDIEVNAGRFIELTINQDRKLRLKSTTAIHKKIWRHRLGSEEMEITVSWKRWFYNENTLHWRIRFKGIGTDFESEVVQALAAFICYWKALIGRSKEGKGRLAGEMIYDHIF